MEKKHFEFHDPTRHKEKGLITLEPNKLISLNFNDYPLIWTGYISGHKISIKQNSSSSTSIDDLDFDDFPKEYDHMKTTIIDLIDEYINDHMD